MHSNIRETHILGRQTRYLVTRSGEDDDRDWLQNAPVSTALRRYQIAHCGVMHARRPFEIVRLNLSGTFFLACFDGAGEVLVDGSWQTVEAGTACLQPPFIPNALKANRTKNWSFVWVRYEGKLRPLPAVSTHSPVIGLFNPSAMRLAMEGLHGASLNAESPAIVQHWIELVHGYVLSFAQTFQSDGRLLPLWSTVERQLNSPWTVERMARLVGMSKEHLRRVSIQTLGRTPMQHVTFLRMRQAAELLATTDQTIARIATQVGYESSFAFSDAFQRWMGFRPSAYRD